MTAENEFFKNRRQAHDWLRESGYQVSRGKFYDDCNSGHVVVNPDKTISRFQVLQYGIAQQKKTVGASVVDVAGAAEADLRKKIAEADMAERKARKLAREEDDMWLNAAEAWAAIAGIINQIRGAIRNDVYLSRREIVEIASGNQDFADEVYQFIEDKIDHALNGVSRSKIVVEFSGAIE